MQLTKFTFYRNTFFNDFTNAMWFESDTNRDDYFSSRPDLFQIAFEREQVFNFVRDRGTIRLPIKHQEMDGVNYCRFLYGLDNKMYYASVEGVHYINDNTTEIDLLIDGVQTYCMGSVVQDNVYNPYVNRTHFNRDDYTKYLRQIRGGTDKLSITSNRFVHAESHYFNDFMVLFQSSSNLFGGDFGTVNKPVMKTSFGQTYDKITSPVDLYLCTQEDFTKLMTSLSDYPWITQNFKQVIQIPRIFLDENDFGNVDLGSIDFDGNLYTLTGDTLSVNFPMFGGAFTTERICEIFGIDDIEELHLLNSSYFTIELYSWDGQQVVLKPELMKDSTNFMALVNTGYNNQVAVIPEGYNTNGEQSQSTEIDTTGDFLNNAIIFNSFNEIPVLIDNYKLSLSQGANQRNLAESRLITNRVSSIGNTLKGGIDKQNIGDLIYNSASILSNVSLSSIGGKINDEYEFYQNQKAQFEDNRMSTPTITSQTNNNSFSIKQGIYGITMKFNSPDSSELEKLRKYYKLFGYEMEQTMSKLPSFGTMKVANFLQFKANWRIPNVDKSLMDVIKLRFESGIRMWNGENSYNPNDNIDANIIGE